MNLEKYADPDLFIPFSTSTEVVQLEDWDSKIEQDLLAPIYGDFSFKYFASNIEFQSSKPRYTDEIELFVNSEYTYQVYVNDKYITSIEKVKSDQTTSDQYKNIKIPLGNRTSVYSIELRATDAHYAGSTAFNAIFHLKVNELENIDQWVMQTGNFENHRYSWLDQINKKNANQLQVAWTFSTGVLFGHQGSPLVVDEIMYIHTPYPNIIYALDLNNGGQILWKYEPRQISSVLPVTCCGRANRGLTYSDGKLFFHQTDTTLVALDAYTGKLIWQVITRDSNDISGTNTATTLVAKDKVIVGIGGGELGVRGHISAYDSNTGEKIWRGYSVGPDSEILIESGKTTVLGKPIGRNTSLKSWRGEQWKIGGGGTWGWYSYDEEESLLYHGTGNPSPWNPVQRPGDNKWTNAIFARDIDTGTVKWVYQFTPHDEWDFDGVNEIILIDREVNGTVKKLLVHFDRNGFVYTLDRVTGELIEAKKYEETVNWATEINLDRNSDNYGRPIVNPKYSPDLHGEDVLVEYICPSQLGVKNHQPASYSPELKLFFVPTIHLCMDYELNRVKYTAGHYFLGADFDMYPVKNSHGGAGNFIAWDNEMGEKIWSIPETFPVWSGPLATAGGIVVYGTFEGYLKVVDSLTGELLYKFKTPTGIIGNVMTYMHDDKQYIAIFSGIGGSSVIGLAAGLSSSTESDIDDAAYTSLGQFSNGGHLTVFSLP